MEENRKRKREILSCRDCRRRKMKCDRQVPICGRCRRGGIAHLCTYDSEPKQGIPENRNEYKSPRGMVYAPILSSSNTPPKLVEEEATHKDLATAVKRQAETIEQLNNRLRILESLVNMSQQSFQQTAAVPRDMDYGTLRVANASHERMLFRGKGFTTHFFGMTHPTSLYANFPEVRTYMAEIYPDSSLERLRHEFNVLRIRWKAENKPQLPTDNLLSLMPLRLVADKLITLYFDTFETTYRILHKPSFWRNYTTYWEHPSEAPPGFAVLLLLAMATVRCAVPNQQLAFHPTGSTARTEAISWILACDSWMRKQSNKHRNMAMYQARLLRLIAASANSYKAKEFYSEAETTLNYFKTAGIHRNPEFLGSNCSVFDQEMRKRLWASAAELELDAAISRGVSSSLSDLYIDCPAPLNINDEDICETSTEIPTSRPVSEYTSTSFLRLSAQSLPLRVRLTSVVNNPQQFYSFEKALQEEQKIQGFLETLPRWDGRYQQASSLLEIELRKFLVYLYGYISSTSQSNNRQYSRMTSYNSSKRIIELVHSLVETENFTIVLSRTDALQAASLCHVAFLSTIAEEDNLLEYIRSTYSDTVEKALNLLEARAIRTGCGTQYLWYISAWNGFVKQRMRSEHSATLKEQVMDRVVRVYHKYMAFQDTSATGLSLRDGFVASTDEPFKNGNPESAIGYAGDIANNFEDIDWSFDDFWSFGIPQV
ncbi:hypothetical protein BP6252_06120 [Coleophoma cylindrospora]|uniref:Zn(2)-C6 fungal-type domain-containing protein n=1 Tax=Coleophoma cylindrospora TaxID=1849047 RepID=A0A3D8RM02_9HELO|nr:hypothetical protein BP6252_06120 [Coleophoma cylindrospora]